MQGAFTASSPLPSESALSRKRPPMLSRPNIPPVPFGVDPCREFRAVNSILKWRDLAWYVRLWEWVRP